jgi:hypothetical protein
MHRPRFLCLTMPSSFSKAPHRMIVNEIWASFIIKQSFLDVRRWKEINNCSPALISRQNRAKGQIAASCFFKTRS